MFVEPLDYSTASYPEGGRRVAACLFADDESRGRTVAASCTDSGLALVRQGDTTEFFELVESNRLGALPEIIVILVPEAGARMLAALARLDEQVAGSGKWIVAITSTDSLDDVFGCLGRSRSSILVGPSQADQLLLFARIRASLQGSAVRELEQEDRIAVMRLTEQVEALVRNMSNWNAGTPKFDNTVVPIGSASGSAADGEGAADRARRTRAPLPDPRLIRSVLRQRQKRSQLFGEELFADPAWDMLLDLTAARAEHQRVSVTSLCLASGVPVTTALRWIGLMVDAGLFQRVKDTEDGRRAFIELTDRAVEGMTRYFAELAPAEAMAA